MWHPCAFCRFWLLQPLESASTSQAKLRNNLRWRRRAIVATQQCCATSCNFSSKLRKRWGENNKPLDPSPLGPSPKSVLALVLFIQTCSNFPSPLIMRRPLKMRWKFKARISNTVGNCGCFFISRTANNIREKTGTEGVSGHSTWLNLFSRNLTNIFDGNNCDLLIVKTFIFYSNLTLLLEEVLRVLSIWYCDEKMAPHEDTDTASEPNGGSSVPPNTNTTANWGALRVSYTKKTHWY